MHPAILALPPAVGLLADVLTCAHVSDFHPTLRLAQDAHDLLFTVYALLHGDLFYRFRSQKDILQLSYSKGEGQKDMRRYH